ncbi:hypothetical protein KP509_04G012500 [Ceratopteris richardii]|uniref:NADP-dependent glyceraldehyde-3-phosphate dehydrogenase n=1 Tax=Ceratopteris richardii TaxID=49495 RepID=A0A8T2UXD0_CERRI|nr:hypothetical protein KP509_04G012500 [Ceratopteris richardii]
MATSQDVSQAEHEKELHKASDIFVRALENENIKYIFGIPGEENLDLLDSLKGSPINLILTRHEQAAGFMAATVGRLTGHVGVCLSTLGPGATNFATAAAYAQLAGFPMMMITGQKPIRKSKQGSFQIVDIVENMRPVTKFTKQIADGDLIPSLVREAIRQAEEERPGAVHLELPEDIAGTMTEGEIFPVHPVRRPIAEEKAIRKAVNMIQAATNPLLLIGAGANRKRTQKMLQEFVDKLGIPFVTTQMGKGVITEAHPLYLGCCALSAMDYPHVCIEKADLIINVGHDVVEKPPFFMEHGKPPLVIHINFYSAKVDNVYFPQLEVIGDIANAIWQIKESTSHQSHWDYEYMLQTKRDMEIHMRIGVDDSSFPMVPQRVVADLRRAMPDDGVVCLDNGMYKIWFARCYKAYQPNTLLLDNALATMGAGLPSAIAVSLLYPQKKVVAVCGDGGFMMNSQEMETAMRLHLNLTVIILNDNAYGMIKWKQNHAGFSKFGLDLENPDFVAYARSYGAIGYRVTNADEYLKLLHECLFLSPHGVKLIEVPVKYEWANHILDKELPGLMEKKMEAVTTTISLALSEAAAIPKTMKLAAKELKPKKEVAIEMKGLEVDSVGPETDVTTCTEEIQGRPTLGATPEPVVYPFYIANKPLYPNSNLDVINKYNGKVFAKCALATHNDIDAAIDAAQKAFPAVAAMASYERKQVLETVVTEVKRRFEEFAVALCLEAGKPIRDSRGEVKRLIDTFSIAAEESIRISGEFSQMDISERAKGYQALVRRFPIGPISMISPFNFPLNLAAHKIAPALAVGCPFVLKPASRTPIGSLLLGEILSQCRLPEGAFSILPCSRDGAELFTIDERFKLVSFTGSPSVGWDIKEKAGKKKVILELGGNAACILEDIVPDMKTVVSRIIHGAFYQSGQSCISVQRVYIRKDLYELVKDELVKETHGLVKGDPLNEDTFIGPLIAESEAKRIENWVDKAVSNGARVLAGGKRDDSFYDATILENVSPDMEVHCEEVFGPVMELIAYDDFKYAVSEVNKSKFGLQAGVFTSDINKAFYAFQQLDVGGVVINDVPSMRIDSQPYGGVKDSGLGREGVKYAMEDMTEVRVMLLRNVGTL